jgi:hypothetical protein
MNAEKILAEMKRQEPAYFLARMRAGLEARLKKIQARGGLFAQVHFSEWIVNEPNENGILPNVLFALSSVFFVACAVAGLPYVW